jgi:hypothetical protein
VLKRGDGERLTVRRGRGPARLIRDGSRSGSVCFGGSGDGVHDLIRSRRGGGGGSL